MLIMHLSIAFYSVNLNIVSLSMILRQSLDLKSVKMSTKRKKKNLKFYIRKEYFANIKDII